jgi:hypothetical protein
MSVERSFLNKIREDSRSVLVDYIFEATNSVRFFSYGSNMNEKKFKTDMNGKLGLINKTTITLKGFKRTLSNRSKGQGIAFSICESPYDKVEGICHDIPISSLDIFLKKEGVLNSDNPSYRIIKVSISGEQLPVLSLQGLKPMSITELSFEKAKLALNYVKISIQGAKCCDLDYKDMIDAKTILEDIIRKKVRAT